MTEEEKTAALAERLQIRRAIAEKLLLCRRRLKVMRRKKYAADIHSTCGVIIGLKIIAKTIGE